MSQSMQCCEPESGRGYGKRPPPLAAALGDRHSPDPKERHIGAAALPSCSPAKTAGNKNCRSRLWFGKQFGNPVEVRCAIKMNFYFALLIFQMSNGYHGSEFVLELFHNRVQIRIGFSFPGFSWLFFEGEIRDFPC